MLLTDFFERVEADATLEGVGLAPAGSGPTPPPSCGTGRRDYSPASKSAGSSAWTGRNYTPC